jgi:hypothetical protein
MPTVLAGHDDRRLWGAWRKRNTSAGLDSGLRRHEARIPARAATLMLECRCRRPSAPCSSISPKCSETGEWCRHSAMNSPICRAAFFGLPTPLGTTWPICMSDLSSSSEMQRLESQSACCLPISELYGSPANKEEWAKRLAQAVRWIFRRPWTEADSQSWCQRYPSSEGLWHNPLVLLRLTTRPSEGLCFGTAAR